MSDLLDKIKVSSNNSISVYFGNFENIYESGCDIGISKDEMMVVIKRVQGVLRAKYDNSSLRVYQYRNMYLRIDHTKKKKYTVDVNLKNYSNSHLHVVEQSIKNTDKESFPVISNYTSISDQKIKTVSSGEFIKVHFIENVNVGENANANTNTSNYIRIDVENYNENRDKRDLQIIVDKIINL